MSSNRKQINLRVSEEFLRMVDDLRRIGHPIPTLTDVVHQAVLEKYQRDVAMRDLSATLAQGADRRLS
jgi:transcriptional regulator of NAD metabolism